MILEMHDVHVNLGLSHVLQGVNLSIKPGETVGLFGRNGVGKTTIVKTIAGWHKPSQGKILFQDQAIQALPPNEITRLGMGLVPEDRRIFPGLSVEGNLKLGLMQVQASERRAAEQRIQMVFERFPRLSERRNQSGGISILLIEQNIHKAIHLCDRHYVVERGRVVLEGNSQDLEERKELIRRVSV
ncbi:ATP-binding cassette domain-containing protein [Polynucleobacter sp.]|uniref:ABC transporter ATP-binding protein n=1 Tax=Polynucleobacter sp. TaxID=2029855 RepID=UPI00259089C9|nr:ATP-binding cassette domain-containing protein [Polynucleobacter sp.]MCX7237958.1 ATP-binding cassette domain-containing protein [Polynucleobacter sp.]